MRGKRELLLRVFDTRQPGASERLRREIRGWHGYAREACIDGYRGGLVVRPSGALDPKANISLEARKGEAARANAKRRGIRSSGEPELQSVRS